ncbi:glycosyltransferase family 2 protein [Candidatus Woesearchaeota archaeon]|nr:glycosyltransferase family 2 protein [Candidatus Woesearchaeota archaeon]
MKISIILPTYNNEKTIEECLKSIFMQDFEEKEFEVLFIDGGSSDKTIEISKKFPVVFLKNPKRNEEAARILGIKKAKGEIITFIDADNVLKEKDWLTRMIEPFEDKEIAFADTLYFFYRKNDKIRVKYQALIGGDDPLVMYLGFYSRWCYLKSDWTDYPYSFEDKGNFLKIRLKNKNKVPAMGSNGFLVRKYLAKMLIRESFIHPDFVFDLVNNGHNCFAKVRIGIVHNQPKFFPNKIRRIKRRLDKEVTMKYNYGLTKKNIIKKMIYIGLILPVFYDTIKGFIKKPCLAWSFHPVACFGEIFLHVFYNLKYIVMPKFKRKENIK